MSTRSSRAARRIGLVSLFAWVVTWASMQPGMADPELWITLEASQEVQVRRASDGALVATIVLGDEDGNGNVEAPWGIAVATRPGGAGTHTFVTREDSLSVLDVALRSVTTTFDLAAELGRPGLELRGIAAAPPRTFTLGVGGPAVVRSFLFVAATDGAGDALGLVLDQDALVGAAARPIVAETVDLVAVADALDAIVLEDPDGEAFLRARFALGATGPMGVQVSSVEIFATSDLDAGWSARPADERSIANATTAPSELRLGTPRGRPLTVLPLADDGELENLEPTGTRCEALGGRLVGSFATGVGADAYTVFATDLDAQELLIVNPATCEVDRFPTGADPVAIATAGNFAWTTVWVADNASDTLTRVNDDGTSSTVPLLAPGAPGPLGPRDIAVLDNPNVISTCEIGPIDLAVVDADEDGSEDDVRITWEAGAGCSSMTEFTVACQCVDDDPDCPCQCSCGEPAALCGCSGLTFAFSEAAADGPLSPVLQLAPWDDSDPTQQSPWKRLGKTTGIPEFVHPDAGDPDASWVYSVTEGDELP